MNIISKHVKAKYRVMTVLLFLCFIFMLTERVSFAIYQTDQLPPTISFAASIDTMKVSRDTEIHPLSAWQIALVVNAIARLHPNYITVDTNWDYANYMQQWVMAIRAVGAHVWFRTGPTQWGNLNGTTGIMTPAQFEESERQFIINHPTFFRLGDILDPCPEPEGGLYWGATYGPRWSWQPAAPNTATRAFNAFLRDTTNVADAALHARGIYGVITTIRSTSPFFPTHPEDLEQATVNKFGYITVDSYPEGYTTDPIVATNARIQELTTIENLWHRPIIIGEMGYSNDMPVSDAVQEAVLRAELNAIARLPYVKGVNYWVGPGSNTAGGYTYILTESGGRWIPRPAAHDLAAFYQAKL